MLVALAFAGVSLLTHAALRVYFRRLHVRHRERFPARGPVLLVANHPAMWTDVLVLDVALRRKLHFLAQGDLFRSRARSAILGLHGALPLVPAPEGETARSRNDSTFRLCRKLFERGEVVALFPEGVSVADRTVLQLKTGAARLALAGASAWPRGGAPVVVPAGLHYASRTRFGSEVTVNVGEPIALEPYRAQLRVDPEAAVRALTEAMRRSLRALILDLPEPVLAAAVTELEPLAGMSAPAGALEIESAQWIAARLEQLRADEPRRFERIRRHRRRYGRARLALGVSDGALLWKSRTLAWRLRAGQLAVLCGLGAIPAAVGALLHAAPWAAGELVAAQVAVDPARISFARIASGMLFFPLNYGLLLLVAMHGWALPVWQWPAALAAAIALGLWTLSYRRYALALGERLRLLALEHRHPRLVRRARVEQHALLRLLAEAGKPGAVRTGGAT
jgi:1-acyl-sn-glycerol-3-phosphate acyltransferase